MKDWVEIFKALSDENRIKILQMLSVGELCACDIQEHFQLTQPTISHHMKVLIQAGLVESEKRGKWMFYGVSKNKMAELLKFMSGMVESNEAFPCNLFTCECDGTRKK